MKVTKVTKVTRRHALTLVALAGAGCATHGTPLQTLAITPAPASVAPVYPAPRTGLNVITYGAIDPLVLQHLNAIGPPLTLRCPARTLAEAVAILSSVAPYDNLTVSLLVETMNADLVDLLANLPHVGPMRKVGSIGLGNELDLAGVTASDAHAWTQRSYTVLRGAGFVGDIYSPSIYCVQPDHLHEYAFPLWQNLPDDIVFDLHRYGDPASGQDGYASRGDEIATIRHMIGPDRRVVISETGWQTRSDADITYALAAGQQDRAWAHLLGAIGWYLYQLNDGVGETNGNAYGLRRVDGTWKGLDGLLV